MPIYHRKTETDYLEMKGALMRKINAQNIQSKIDEQERQAKELEEIIKVLTAQMFS